ncbi:MAG: adenylate/guanylate cyclase domain-containing protein [Pseudomonadota bacterium]
MDNELPVSFDDEDRARLERLRVLLTDGAASLDRDGALDHGRGLLELADRLVEDLDDAGLLYGSIVEHSTTLENELTETNDKITQLIEKMKRYLSDQLYRRIVGGQAEGTEGSHQRQHLSVFFSDIVGFTNITDTIEPETLSHILNRYLNEMARICGRWGGAIDKFIGDAVMVYFGDDDGLDPRQAARACVRMALEMLQSLGPLRKEWEEAGTSFPLQIRIGINSGFCTAGNFGSDERMDYTLIGGNVNVASRLEGQAPPGGILVSAATYRLVEDIVEAEPRGKIKVKGVAQPIETFEIIGHREEDRTETEALFTPEDEGFTLREIRVGEATSDVERRMYRENLEAALAALAKPRAAAKTKVAKKKASKKKASKKKASKKKAATKKTSKKTSKKSSRRR